MSMITNKKNGASARRSEPTKMAHAECTADDIRCRAYEIYQARNSAGPGGGDQIADWLRAEQELAGTSQGEPAAAQRGTQHGRSDRAEMKPQSRGRALASSLSTP